MMYKTTDKSTRLILSGILSLGLALSLAGCGGGHDSSSSSGGGGDAGAGGGGTATVSGTAIANNVSGATVTVVAVKPDGTDDITLCSDTTDSSGKFSIANCSTPPSGDGVRVEISKGTYTSEADTSKTITGTALSTLLSNITDAQNFVVTPLTTFANSNADAAMAKGGGTLASYIAAADAAISKDYGLPSGTTLSTLAPDYTATTGSSAEAALLFGTLEQLAINVGKSPADLLSAIASDLSDGIPDGKTAAGKPVTYADGSAAPNTLANSDLLSALNSYLGSSATILVKDGTMLDAGTVVDPVRGAVVSTTPSAFALNIGSSGAITELVSGGKQLILIAARASGLQEIDLTDPTNPQVNNLSTLNSALLALPTPLSEVDGVLAVPNVGNEAALYDYSEARLVIVDVSTQQVLNDLDLSSALVTQTGFSGGEAYISGGITDFTSNVIWLATGDGYYPYCVSSSSDTRYCNASSSGKLGTAIPLAGTQISAENIGGATDPVNHLLFSPNYGPQGSGGGLQVVDLSKATAYAMDDNQFQSAFAAPETGGPTPFGIADSGGFDNLYQVGILMGEHVGYVGFIDMRDPSKLGLDDTTHTFTLTDPSIAKTVRLDSDNSYYDISGVALDPDSHLVLMMGGNSDNLLVGQLDNPAAPANGTWSGLKDWKHWTADYTEFESAGDPHAVGVLPSQTNGKSYGFMLSDSGNGGAVIMIDLQAFLSAAGSSADPHELASTPFDDSIIRTLPLSTASASISAVRKSAAVKVPERRYGITVRKH